MLYVRFYPVNLTPIATKVLAYVAPQTTFTFDELWFTYDGKFTLEAKNVAFEGMGEAHIGAIESLKFRLSHHSLLFLSPSPKHVVVKGVFYEGDFTPTDKDKPHPEKKLGELFTAAPFLKMMKHFRHLKTIEVSDVNIVLNDTQTQTQWALKNAHGKGMYYPKEGLNILLSGQFAQNDERFSPAELEVKTSPDSKTSYLTLNISDLNTEWFSSYIPENYRNYVKAKLYLSMQSSWTAQDGWQPIKSTISLKNPLLTIPELYGDTKQFDIIELTAAYLFDKQQLNIENLSLKKGSVDVELSGFINELSEDIHVNVKGKLSAQTFSDIVEVLPDQRMQKTMPFLENHVDAKFTKKGSLEINAYAKKLMSCEPFKPCPGIILQAKIAPQSKVRPLEEGLWLVSDSEGDFKIENGRINIVVPSGTMGQQIVKDVSTTIANIQTPKTEKRVLYVKGNLSGPVEEAFPTIKPIFHIETPYNFTGTHETSFLFKKEIEKDESTQQPIPDVTLTTKLAKTSLDNGFKGRSLVMKSGEISLKNKVLHATGSIQYATSPADINVTFNTQTDALSGNVSANMALAELPLQLPETIHLNGNAPLKASFSQSKKKAPISFEVKADLSQTQTSVTPLNWQHEKGKDLNLTMQGVWKNQDKSLNVDMFTLTGHNAEIAGAFYYPTQKTIKDITVQASPFKLGTTKANIEYQDRKLRIAGQSFDLSKAFSFKQKDEQKAIEWPKNLDAEIQLDRLWVKNGFLQDVQLSALRQNELWQNVSLKGMMPNINTPFSLDYAKAGTEYTLNTSTDNLGSLLQSTGLYENMTGGRFRGQMSLNESHNGNGVFTLNNMRIVKAPILMKLLSLLSLEQLFSSNRGIEFERGVFPISKKGTTYNANDAYVKGPSMAIKFKGDIIPQDRYLNLNGSFVPTAGINRAISSIPLLGDILTGSQDGMFVADFKVKGNWSDPDVTVKPLSTVTPGLVKDFFKIITGGD